MRAIDRHILKFKKANPQFSSIELKHDGIGNYRLWCYYSYSLNKRPVIKRLNASTV